MSTTSDLFGPGEISINLDWSRWQGIYRSYATGFKDAAELLVDSFEPIHPSDYPVQLFFPIATLYRHAFELQMKYIILLGVEITALKESPQCMDKHFLESLWRSTRQVLAAVWGDDPATLDPIEGIILQIHESDRFGQGFRYPTTKGGTPTLKNIPTEFSLRNFQTIANQAFRFLDGCLCRIEEIWSDQQLSMRDRG